MQLDVTSQQPILDLSADEAFTLQAALCALLHDHAMNCAVGLAPSLHGTGQDHINGKTLNNVPCVLKKGDRGTLTSLVLYVRRPYTKI